MPSHSPAPGVGAALRSRLGLSATAGPAVIEAGLLGWASTPPAGFSLNDVMMAVHAAQTEGWLEKVLCWPALGAAVVRQPREARNPQAWAWYGATLARTGRCDEAERCFRNALAVDPAYAEAWENLGALKYWAGRLPECLEAGLRALEIDPRRLQSRRLVFDSLFVLGELDFARQIIERSLQEDPDDGDMLCSAVNLYRALGNTGQATAMARRAARHKASAGAGAVALTAALVEADDLPGAWRAFRGRWKADEAAGGPRPFLDLREWNGTTCRGPVLIWGEQGIGDEIMWSTLLPDALARSGVIVECDARLVEVLARTYPEARVLPRTTPPAADLPRPAIAHCAMGDLPALLRRSRAAFADGTARFRPLVADPAGRARQRARLTGGSGERLIGIAWHTTNPKFGLLRSVAAAELIAALDRPGTRLVSLQHGAARADLAGHPRLITDPAVDPVTGFAAFVDHVAAMDAVVSIDNSTAHLAAALGLPTAVLLHSPPDWRWCLGEGAWYPTARTFRRPAGDGWAAPLADAAAWVHHAARLPHAAEG